MSHRPSRLLSLMLGLVALGSGVAVAAPPGKGVDVVLDPGHGGSNTGSPGRGEVLEKRVTLAIAKLVRHKLEAAGLSVQLTRTRDVYVPIRARARMSNTMAPSCFVSIHANASADHARRGVETYLLSRDAVDIRARRAAGAATDDPAALLAELQTLRTARASLRLAELVQRQLAADAIGLVDRGVRQASHDVLADAEAPGILVEVGFLDHPVEGRLLASAQGQEAVASRLAAGILAYVRGTTVPSAPLALGR